MVEESNEFGSLSEEQMEIAELFLGVRLPDDYRGFLLDHNGGRPLRGSFGDGGGLESVVDYFYGIHKDYDRGLVAALETYRERVPDNLIPIGRDPFGNQICLGLRRDRGKVFFWDHEREVDEGEVPTYDNLTPIAGSFREFIEGLRPLEE